MSLEEALKENTAALQRLYEVLRARETTPQAPPAAPQVPPAAAKSPKTEEPEQKFTYEEHVRKPFLQLLNSKREAAMKLLADLGVQNLKGFENQPEKFAELYSKIHEVQNAKV